MKKIITIIIIGFLLFIPSFSQSAKENYESSSLVPNQTNDACMGYTLIGHLGNSGSAKLIDMEGNRVNSWFSLFPSTYSFPVKMLSNGDIIAGKTPTIMPIIIQLLFGKDAGHAFADNKYLVQMDWKGKHKWSFNNWDEIVIRKLNFGMSSHQHHDFQREGNPVGYYAPGQDFVENGKTLILAHKEVLNTSISSIKLCDDVIYEVDWNGEITDFVWHANEHFQEFGFSEDAIESISIFPGLTLPNVYWNKSAHLQGFSEGDWLHINSISRLGKNKWYDEDSIKYSHFHPENIILDSRHANFIAIIDYQTGNVVWRAGPDYSCNTLEGQKIGQIVGPHNAHMIPEGLPGEGNILVFDNGGAAGYGEVSGQASYFRNYSRVIEFNPVTMEIVWEYSNFKSVYSDEIFRHYCYNVTKGEEHHFYSPYVSSAQRLPNGNTLITEGFSKRVFEVNQNCELIWEYSPNTPLGQNIIPIYYRAYRIPPEWVPNNKANYGLWKDIYKDNILLSK